MQRVLLAIIIILGLAPVSPGQVATGVYPFGAFDAKGFDTVNIGNLNVHFAIPIFHKPGRAGLDFANDLAYDSAIWTPVGVSGSQAWQPAALWGWTADVSSITGNLAFFTSTTRCFDTSPYRWAETDEDFVFTDTNGVAHTFVGPPFPAIRQCSTGLGVQSGTFPANDNSGITLVAKGYGQYTIQYPNGKTVYPTYNGLASTPSAIDANGNMITSTGTVFTDTTGTPVLTLTGSGNSSSPRLLTYPTYVGGTAGTASATIHFSSYNIQTAFGCSGISEYSASSISLVDYVQLADGETYQFAYESTPGYAGYVTGRLATITLPTGGRINYSYSGGSNGIVCQDGGTATVTRGLLDDPLTPSETYTRTPGGSGAPTTHTDVVDALSNHAQYDFVNDPSDTYNTPYVINHIQYNGAASGTPIFSEQSCLNLATPDCTTQSFTLPITNVSTTTQLDGTSTKKSVQWYNGSLLTGDAEYDFGNGAPGPLIHSTAYGYNTTFDNGIVDHLAQASEFDGSNNILHEATYAYDETTPTSTSGLPQHNPVSGSRGNLTSVRNYTIVGSTGIVAAQYSYDDAGQVLTSKDANSNSTTYTYDSGTDTFLTATSMPTTSGVSHSTRSTYDTVSGVKLTDVDQNSNTTTYTYDSMLRPSAVFSPGGGYQSYSYSLSSSTPFAPYVSTSVFHSGSSYPSTMIYLDPYGRQMINDTYDTPQPDLVLYSYDANSNLYSVSNPARNGDSVFVTTTTHDALGRPLLVTDSDGSSQSKYSYSGNSATVTDEAGKQREIVVDGIGRTAAVFEPDSSKSLTLETDYLYAQNFTAGSGSSVSTYQNIVHQKGGSGNSSDWRTRVFTYDMLGRMLSATTPEAGTTTYTYPSGSGSCAGVLTAYCTRRDANSTSTTYAYDALNRLTGKTYGGSTIGTGTSSVGYSYDQTSYNGLTISNGIGLRTGMSDGSGSTAWSFDGMGRTSAIRKTINSVTKQTNYTYNADGSVNTVQDFGGTTFTYSYDAAARPTSIVDGSSNTYASGAVYNAAGELTSLNHELTSGGGAYVRSISYNNRLQPSVISATLGGSTIQSLSYGYGTGGTNNGNILFITNGMDSTGHRDQTFTYDNLNRLASAHDGTHWGETYSYDNWGNLYQTTQMSGMGGNNWSVTASTSNQLSNLTYDSAGEVTQDQFGNTFSYDAEGRILTGGSGTYIYDGDGNRVMKTASSTTTLYWPGTSGLLDESNSNGSTMGKQVQFAGLLVWHEDTSGSGNFLFHDHLGSTRLTGNASGSLADDNDYLPFGTLYYNYGSSQSDNHYLFTGYESDQSESSTDYATFRNLSTSMGRMNRPDPYDGSYDLTNPQSLNRYSYVLNNPLSFTDRLGLYCVGGSNPAPYNSSTGSFGQYVDLTTQEGCQAGGGTWVPDPPPSSCPVGSMGVNCVLTVNGSDPSGVGVAGSDGGNDSSGGGVGGGNGAPNNLTKLTPAQCGAAKTVLGREAQYGTPKAARMSGNTFGDNTLAPFNSTYVPNLQSPVGQIDLDWFTDVSGYGGGQYTNAIVYTGAKSLWTLSRLSSGMAVGHYLPFADPGERNAVWQSTINTSYADIFTPAYMQQACGGH
jgi:RHS repeat-associated protein